MIITKVVKYYINLKDSLFKEKISIIIYYYNNSDNEYYTVDI